jgi:ubiquinone/menaquinone biosynthesis C-methylase UbiE
MQLTYLLALLLLIDALKLWRRAVSYPQLGAPAREARGGADPEGVRGGHASPPALLHEFQIIAAPGVVVPQDVVWRAAQWADDEGVLVVDLLPEGWAGPEALSALMAAHPIDYALKPFAPGVSAGVAVLVHESVSARHPAPPAADGYLAWLKYAQELKRFAPWESALVVATGWRQPRPLPAAPAERRAALKMIYGGAFEQLQWGSLCVWGWLAYALAQSVAAREWSGWFTLTLWLAQPALILARTPLRAAWLPYTLARPLLDLQRWWSLLGPRAPLPGAPQSVEALRPEYDALIQRGEGLARGEGPFFEARRDTCPLCESGALRQHLSLKDQYQGKPGRFRLDRCGACGHIFQNPRLSIEGLGFYYRDFYDGLGAEGMDMIFGASEESYRQRVAMIRARCAPLKWLDVGGGHGHFALIAKHLMPQTTFDVLDLSESVEWAARRGWCAEGLRGLFPERAPSLRGRYDGVSMSHYLEHTTDPRAELRAAAEVLGEGGFLMIEVPDPESRFGRLLGGLWLPWFQPQHLHFMSVGNLSRALEESGFEVVEVDRAEAHQSVDVFFAALILIQRLAPDPSRPWRRGGPIAALWRVTAVSLGLPLVVLGALTDRALRPLFTRPEWSNTYRVLARRVSAEGG